MKELQSTSSRIMESMVGTDFKTSSKVSKELRSPKGKRVAFWSIDSVVAV